MPCADFQLSSSIFLAQSIESLEAIVPEAVANELQPLIQQCVACGLEANFLIGHSERIFVLYHCFCSIEPSRKGRRSCSSAALFKLVAVTVQLDALSL